MPEIVSGNKLNDVSAKNVRTRSNFNLSYHHFNTHRFGDITPHFALDVVPDDENIELRSQHDLSSYTLKAPLMQSIEMKKDYFLVPMSAILPRNWEKVYVNPNIGDDVDAEKVNCILHDITGTFKSFVDQLRQNLIVVFQDGVQVIDQLPAGTSDFSGSFRDFLSAFFYLEYFFSDGNLLSSLGAHLSPLFSFDNGGNNLSPVTGLESRNYSFDELFDAVFADLVDKFGGLQFVEEVTPGVTTNRYVGFGEYDWLPRKHFTLREFLEMVRDEPSMVASCTLLKKENGNPLTSGDADDTALYKSTVMYKLMVSLAQPTDSYPGSLIHSIAAAEGLTLNLSKPLAYQIVCAHFYTNDKVDYIYSADLYRQYVQSFLDILDSGDTLLRGFRYNGVTTPYDVLSGYVLSSLMLMLYPGSSSPAVGSGLLYYELTGGSITQAGVLTPFYRRLEVLNAVLGIKHSLRFVDYFAGAKTRPLAVGDVNVDVNANAVSVVDITRNIQMQRFLNAVNQTGRRVSEYIKGIFGASMVPDMHEPQYLAHTSDVVVGTSIENTGEAQQTQALSVTSTLRSNAARYAFTLNKVERPGVVIGVTYYDIARSYFQTIERPFFHVDRFDMFNPDLQFIGDQPVYEGEIFPQVSGDVVENAFGYQTRNMEYKQRYNVAAGGFVRNLPGYAFLADYDSDRFYDISNMRHIGPSFIRSRSSELDRFYLSLTGYSLSSYFHFIVDNFNQCSATRPMAWTPTIL